MLQISTKTTLTTAVGSISDRFFGWSNCRLRINTRSCKSQARI